MSLYIAKRKIGNWFILIYHTIGGLLDDAFNILPIEVIVNKYKVNITFLEYHSIRLKFNDLIEFLDKPVNNDILQNRQT